ncbi:carbamate kinase [Gleimia hominis]|uniref:Carbamate kinase n=1 Tax=Gleimia hominis TaxID=595468 RepID=A0ABU3I9A4_9ACTO|nr:carbamate kinase [Gleimia hominis]MDT3766773.1 carbamate kinase [Gleimia hominis]WIK64174.1 carbamate kinase [Gleimia hominis]
MGKTIVIALGGNALGKTPEEQLELIKQTATSIVDIVQEGAHVIVTHGNGPQVGMIKVATDEAAKAGAGTPVIPFAECGAMSQGYIGYHLQQAIDAEITRRNLPGQAVSLVTETEVDENDPAFEAPSKPVGAFFTEDEAKKLMEETGNTYVEDSGRGWRWVVASPLPKAIVQMPTIKTLAETDTVVVASGGGGIPVVAEGDGFRGVPAVIDKDRSAALLASELGADTLLILTAVDSVYVNFNQPDQRELRKESVEAMEGFMADGQFAKGSMLPKVEACVQFAKNNPGAEAIITSLAKAKDGLNHRAGTSIVG